MFRRAILAAAAAATALLAFAGTASADAVYHSQHMDLVPVGNAPLRSGFVENIHPNGPRVYAHEIYVLNGASPNTAYVVRLIVHVGDPTCSEGAGAIFATTPLETNTSGNGRADLVIPSVPNEVRFATHGVRWEVWAGGTLAYRTACTAVTLD